jgi:hypothetical protein
MVVICRSQPQFARKKLAARASPVGSPPPNSPSARPGQCNRFSRLDVHGRPNGAVLASAQSAPLLNNQPRPRLALEPGDRQPCRAYGQLQDSCPNASAKRG